MGASNNTSRCNFCDKEVSTITTSLQNRPSSERWRKFGKCCASCDSDSLIEFDSNLDGYVVEAAAKQNGAYSYSQNNRKHITYYPESDSSEVKKNQLIKKARRLIKSGKIIGASGAFLFIFLIYVEYALFAFGGLIVLLTGILLCRIGVFRIASCKRYDGKKRVEHNSMQQNYQ